jgi:taurine dioxygenase
LDHHALDTLQDAFLAYCLLVFPNQHLTPESQVAFTALWGEPVVALTPSPYPEIVQITPEIYQATNLPKEATATEVWHYDEPWTEAPPKITTLSAVKVPHGGDTMWSNQYLAYERLSPSMRSVLEGLRVRFRSSRALHLQGRLNVPEAEIPQAVHPLVRTHPQTGRKALYVTDRRNLFAIEGWTDEESWPLLGYLYQQSTRPDNVYRHRWRAGDLVMWDNRCTMHYAVHDYGAQERVLNRVTLRGEVPE